MQRQSARGRASRRDQSARGGLRADIKALGVESFVRTRRRSVRASCETKELRGDESAERQIRWRKESGGEEYVAESRGRQGGFWVSSPGRCRYCESAGLDLTGTGQPINESAPTPSAYARARHASRARCPSCSAGPATSSHLPRGSARSAWRRAQRCWRPQAIPLHARRVRRTPGDLKRPLRARQATALLSGARAESEGMRRHHPHLRSLARQRKSGDTTQQPQKRRRLESRAGNRPTPPAARGNARHHSRMDQRQNCSALLAAAAYRRLPSRRESVITMLALRRSGLRAAGWLPMNSATLVENRSHLQAVKNRQRAAGSGALPSQCESFALRSRAPDDVVRLVFPFNLRPCSKPPSR